MPSPLNIDAALLQEAMKIGGHKYKKDAVNTALREYVKRHKQRKIIELFDTIDYDKDFNYKNERRKR